MSASPELAQVLERVAADYGLSAAELKERYLPKPAARKADGPKRKRAKSRKATLTDEQRLAILAQREAFDAVLDALLAGAPGEAAQAEEPMDDLTAALLDVMLDFDDVPIDLGQPDTL